MWPRPTGAEHRSVNGEDQGTHVGLGPEGLLGGTDIDQGEGAANHRANLAPFDVTNEPPRAGSPNHCPPPGPTGSTTRDDLVAGFFRFVVDHLCREAGGPHVEPGGLLVAADDVRRPLPRSVTLQALTEDVDQQRGEV